MGREPLRANLHERRDGGDAGALVERVAELPEDGLDSREACGEVLESDDPHVADPEDLPPKLRLATLDNRAVFAFEHPAELLVVEPRGVPDRAHRVRLEALPREHLEAQGGARRAGGGAEKRGPLG